MKEYDSITCKILSLAGLCRNAGGVVIGTNAVIDAVRSKKIKPSVVIVSSDASDRTVKQIFDKAKFYGVIAIRLNADAQEISKALGKTAPCAAAAVMNRGPSGQIEELAEKLLLINNINGGRL